ncbi:hypothetical protein BGZ83_003419 [Gryganskiella cystojenkinii]|nr:hypothetical protein BGZ83_003419 [Gryganskiella cystojenkinii]
MTKQRTATATTNQHSQRQQQRDERSPSESGADNDNDQDNYNDMDQDGDHEDHDEQDGQANGAAGTARIKRRRLTQACDVCRKKKIKCDGLKPTCANCAKVDANCTYLPSMKKRGPRQGYIELLEKRLDKMEQMLQHGPAAGLEQDSSLDRRAILAAEESSDSTDVPKSTREKEKIESRYFGNTSVFGHYAMKDRPYFHVDKCKDIPSEPSLTLISSKRPLYGIKDEIPRKDILDHLINLFFDSVYYQFPIIHPATFMKQYKEGKVAPNLLNAICAAVARFSDHPDVLTTPGFLAGEPFATNVRGSVIDSIDTPTVSNVQALLFLSMYEYGAARGPRAWMFGGMAIRQAQELGLNREDSSPVFYLQGDWVMRETRRRTFWACFTMDVLASSSSGRPRMMDERDCEVLLPSDDKAWQEARPVVTAMLDEEQEEHPAGTNMQHSPLDPVPEPTFPNQRPYTTASSTSAAPPSGTDGLSNPSNANDLPQSNSHPELPPRGHNLSSFAYLIRILAILGKVSQYVNRPHNKKSIPPNEQGSEFSVLDGALTAWMNSIPTHLTYSVANADMLKDKAKGCIVVFMHVVYHTSVVLLHRPILAADKTTFPMDSHFVETSVARCAEAASKVSEVLDFVSMQSCPPRVFISSFFAYPVFTTATVHITNAFASDPSIAARARRNLSTHVKILQTMKTYWAMADKFFYIIRDLYSIQSKISSSAANGGIIVPQVVSHNPHGCSRNHAADSAVQTLKAQTGDREKTANATEGQQAPGHGPAGQAAAPRMVVNGKLASISSFLKSDSGLIALWRRATEMQVIDEANQEKRKAVAESQLKTQSVSVEDVGETDMDEKEIEEHRIRMNQLEIQEINQEFERQWKAKMAQEAQKVAAADPSTASTEPSVPAQEGNDQGGDLDLSGQDSSPQEKRQKTADVTGNPRATKQPRIAKPVSMSTRPNSSRKPRSHSSANSAQSDAGSNGGVISSSWSTGQQEFNSDQSGFPIQQNPIQGPGSVVTMASEGNVFSAVGGSGDGSGVSQHLMNIYAQQHQDQESLSQSIDMAQNAQIQRQQQQLQQQQQQAQMSSSLAFGPVSAFSSSFMPQGSAPTQSNAPFQPFQQQQQQHQAFSGSGFGPPLVYGSNYNQTAGPRVQEEPLNSIFDFAMPLGDLNFLSSSFQMTPMMMQTQGQTPSTGQPSLRPGGISDMNSSPASSSAMAQQGSIPGSLGSDSNSTRSPSSPSTSIVSNTMLMPGMDNSAGRGRAQSDSKSPPSQNISPGLHSFMMSDELFADMQSNPDSLVRYLQHHHQQQQRQEQQQQLHNMQPLLNQQNSLIYDDYLQWMPPGSGSNTQMTFSPQQHPQPPRGPVQVPQPPPSNGQISSMGMDLDPSSNNLSRPMHMQSSIPSFS